jgi:hypothetical protein
VGVLVPSQRVVIVPPHLKLLRQMHEGKCFVLVHVAFYSRRWNAFVYLLGDAGREAIRTATFGVLIDKALVKVKHVFPNGEMLYEAVG